MSPDLIHASQMILNKMRSLMKGKQGEDFIKTDYGHAAANLAWSIGGADIYDEERQKSTYMVLLWN